MADLKEWIFFRFLETSFAADAAETIHFHSN
jgi:hypothetical protein